MDKKKLSIEEKIGQMLCFAHRGTNYSEQLRILIEEHHISNIIHFAHNIVSIKQIKQLYNTIQKISKYPDFISLDQEGGMVRRIVDGINYLPGAMSLAATNESIYEITKACNEDLKQLGFNINYAPVADINTNPYNPVINSRSFGDDPHRVANLVTEAFVAIQDAKILPTLKHFPGHGDTNVDSHLGLPIINKTKEELFKEELVPYLVSIKAGLEGIMIGHILFPQLDSTYPSSLSYEIITKLLKEELGFNGLITTDSLTMKAIWGKYPIREIVKRGVLAGNDILVFCGGANLIEQKEIIASFIDLVKNKEIPMSRIDYSLNKIFSLKNKYCQEEETKQLNRFAKLSDLMINKTICLNHNKGLVPLKQEDKVLIIFPKIHLASLVDNQTKDYETLGKYLNYPEEIITKEQESFEAIIEKQENFDKIILATLNLSKADNILSLYDKLDKTKIIHIALRSPYDLLMIKDSGASICTFDCTKESLKSVSTKLFSNEFFGSLPIKLK